MRILLLTHIFPPAVDGGSKIIAKAGEYLGKKGHEIMVLTTNCHSTDDFVNPKSPTIQSSSRPTIRLPVYKHLRRPLKLLSLISQKLSPRHPEHSEGSFFLNLLGILQLGPIFKFIPFIKALIKIHKFKPDWIIAGPFPTTIVLYSNLIRKLTSLRSKNHQSTLLTLPCFHQFDPAFSRKPLIKTLQNSNLIWTLTQHEANYLSKKYHILKSKFLPLGAGIDKSFLKPVYCRGDLYGRPNNPVILFLGNFSAHKRIEFLVKAFQKLSPKYPQLTITIAGQKTLYYPKIQKLLNNIPKNIRPKITIIPKRYNPKTLKYYLDNCTILVNPSIHESFGLTFIEAMARQKPIIGTNIPPVKELIKKSNGGLIFKIDSLNDLVKQIKKLLDNPALYRKLSQNGYNYIKQNHTWDKIINNLVKHLDK
ncbi:glycosyltransferase family 4 protein [Patescibacteria group bacterium]|nr:glycosyltransferase family 4 protein [Patescibacteria group bacterium]